VELLVVGGHPARRGVVVSATYPVRAFGVHAGMPMGTALRLCPQAVAAPVPWATVRRMSRDVFAVARGFALRLERASIDEGFLLLPDDGTPLEAALRRLREAVLRETGVRISVGGAAVRFLAKIAADRAKPRPGTGADGVYVIPAGAEAEWLGRHGALKDIPGVGPALLEELARRGVSSIESARAIDLNTYALWLGPARARFLWERVRGIGGREVAAGDERRKSISAEETFESDLSEWAALERELALLVADVGRTLRREGHRARTIGVKVRGSDFEDRQKSRSLSQAVQTDGVILGVALELLREARRLKPGPLRLMGVTLSSLEGPGSVEQLSFPEIVPPLESDEARRLAREADARPNG
jgi:DNA polymerase IV